MSWITSNLDWLLPSVIIPLFVSAGGTIVTYYLQRKRDDIAWQREKEKIQHQFRQERAEFVVSKVLPALWQKLQVTLGHIKTITSRYIQSPHLNSMTEEQLNEFLKVSRLGEYHRQAILRFPDKDRYWADANFWYDMEDAKRSFAEFNNYLVDNRIYVNEELNSQFEQIDRLISLLLTSVENARRMNNPQLEHSEVDRYYERSGPVLANIESLLQQKLSESQAASAKPGRI